MPAKSQVQQEMMGAALARKQAGKSLPSDPKMSEEQLKEFASTPRKGLPKKKGPRKARMILPEKYIKK